MIKKTAETAERLDKIRKAAEGGYGFLKAVVPALLDWTHKHL